MTPATFGHRHPYCSLNAFVSQRLGKAWMEDPFIDSPPSLPVNSTLNVTSLMSVSPMVARPTEAGRSPYNASNRPLSVRTGSRRGPSASTASKDSVTGDLNQQIKEKYIKGKKIGEGTYATVFVAHLKGDESQKFAIKKGKVSEADEGLSVSAIREVRYLQELSHGNIIKLYDVFSSKDQNLNMVLEFLPLGDLETLIKDTPKPGSPGTTYGAADIKAWMAMLGRAVWFCHENFILHRDIKPNNLLIAPDGEIKLADFGLARSFADPEMKMTFNVITRWYRPPELFYQARYYGGAVDVWSVGCVFAELIFRVPFLAGDTDIGQLQKICQALGTPTESNWPGVTSLPTYCVPNNIGPTSGDATKRQFTEWFGTVGADGVDLIMSTFKLDPRKRCTARQFLQHKYWTSEPAPTSNAELPKKGGGPQKAGADLARLGNESNNDLSRRRGEIGKNPVARRLDFS